MGESGGATGDDVAAQGKATDDSPASVGDDGIDVVRRASPLRLLLKLGVAAAALAGLGGGGLLAYRAYAAHRAQRVPQAQFERASVTIGNDLFEVERPAHDVEVAAFALDKTEVTTAAYRTCLEQGGCTEPAKGAFCNLGLDGRDSHPMNCVTHAHATAFCAWAGKRLPTEKEWERAARVAHGSGSGGSGKGAKEPPRYARGEGLFPWGTSEPTRRHANVCGKECRLFGAERGQAWPSMWQDDDDGFPTTAPVGSFPKGQTPDGLDDMAGNVWEWTKSPYCEYPAEACGNSVELVIRGGGFLSYHPRNLEVTTREAMPAEDANHGVGFRCAQSL